MAGSVQLLAQHKIFQEEHSGAQSDALEIKMGMIGNSRGHGGWPVLNSTGFRGRDTESVEIFPTFYLAQYENLVKVVF